METVSAAGGRTVPLGVWLTKGVAYEGGGAYEAGREASEGFGQAGNFLQALVIRFLVIFMRFDEDDAGRPLRARRGTQILEQSFTIRVWK